MGEDVKETGGGPEEAKRMPTAIPDDTEGHRRKVASLTEEPGVGPDEAKRMPTAIPDTGDDTEGHRS